MFERFVLTEFSNENILNIAKKLDPKGWIQVTEHYCYLKVDDHFIHATYPLLTEHGEIEKPDYFNPSNEVGAHISVIYPEEMTLPDSENIGQIHRFSVIKCIKAHYGSAEYFALLVKAPTLTSLRQRHHLTDKPVFKGHTIGFHITIGVKR